MMNKGKVHLDFLASLVLMAISAFIMIESLHIFGDVNEAFYVSPGLLPLFLGLMLMLCAVILFIRCFRTERWSVIRTNLVEWLVTFRKSQSTHNMMLGIVLMAVYVFVLIPVINFWIASFIFLFLFMFLFASVSIVTNIIIGLATPAFVYVLFQLIFQVPLP